MIRRFMKYAIAGLSLILAILAAVTWYTFRIYVPEDRCAVLIRKMGDPLPADQIVATALGQKGIELDVLGPGRHFRDPFRYDWELKPLTVIPAGNPATWKWIHTVGSDDRSRIRAGDFTREGDFPMIGVVTRLVGKAPPPGQLVVGRESGCKGILEEVLTPGTYKLNPYVYKVEMYPATVIPPGFVGVVTNLFGEQPAASQAPLLAELTGDDSAASAPTDAAISYVRPLAQPGQRGTLRDVLQPGMYFINPKVQQVTIVEIGFNEFSQTAAKGAANARISFPSDTGYLITVGVTVVWGIDPRHAAEVINEFGNVDGVLQKIIEPQLRSICRNIGSTYAARDFIQGEKRELFQKNMTQELQRVCNGKHIEVLLALVREIEVHAPEGAAGLASGEDLKRTIQESYIAIENQITKEKQRDAATAKAQLEEFKKKIDIARETIRAETRVMVANIRAEAEKQASEIDAQAALEIAAIQQQVADLDAQRTRIMGQAQADVEKLKKTAEADGYKMLVDAFGSPQAYNLYTFAENFEPDSISLFYAGEGTFWTDLRGLQDAAAAQVLRQQKSPPNSGGRE